MICITVLGSSPERRFAIIERLNAIQRASISQLAFLPELSIKPISPEEIKFILPPDICIIDEEYASHDLMEIGKIKKALPHTALVVDVNEKLSSLLIIEQLARLGISDIISNTITHDEFFRKIILLTKNRERQKHGMLVVVDSGKGGSGVTSIVAALGEFCARLGKKTGVIDLDTETQDLSRFLQIKPFVNENLDSLISLDRPIVRETVEQCFVQHAEIENLYCASPPISDFYPQDLTSTSLRSYVSFLESVDSSFDVTIVDAASVSRVVRHALYRVSDKVLFVLTNDPASMYGAVERIQQAHTSCEQKDVYLLENGIHRFGLPTKIFRLELSRSMHATDSQWIKSTLPFCSTALRWPGSYSTMYTCGKRAIRKCVQEIAATLTLTEKTEPSIWFRRFFKSNESISKCSDLALEDKTQMMQIPLLKSDNDLVTEAALAKSSQVSIEEEEFISNASLH